MNRMATWMQLVSMLGKIALIASQIAVAACAAPPATSADKAAVSDATVETRKNAQPELPDSLGKTSAAPESSPAESKPPPRKLGKLTICTQLGCFPCIGLHRAADAGELDDFEVEWITKESGLTPNWVRWYPCVIMTAADGTPRVYPNQSTEEPPTFEGVQKVVELWHKLNPGARLQAADGRRAASQTLGEKLEQFMGAGGKFSFTPNAARAITMDDGTYLTYPSIQGSYTVQNGQVELKLEKPFPQGTVKRFGLRFGFQVFGAGGPEPTRDPSKASIRIDTNRGSQRVKITTEGWPEQ